MSFCILCGRELADYTCDRCECMLDDKETQYKPDVVSHPGETLLETLETMGVSLTDLAAESGIDIDVIDQIVTGEGSITPEIAQGLEDALGVPYSFWRNRQVNYDIAKNKRIT